MKTSVIFSVVLVLLMGSVYANEARGKKGYDNARCVECHEDMTMDCLASVHRAIPCLNCHPGAAQEDHDQVARVDCRQCHAPHGEKLLHDAHTRVDCKACHVKGGILVRNPESDRIIFSNRFRSGAALPAHQAIQAKTEEGCRGCHYSGNALGASAMVLPGKTVLCMPCHAATLLAGEKITLVSLALFGLGMLGLGAVWFSGSMGKRALWADKKTKVKTRVKPTALFSGSVGVLKKIFMDVVLVQRLFQQSRTRWFIHALIFFPLVFRFGFGLAALLLSIFLPGWPVTMAMLDKNHAVPALFFEVTGVMILAGALAAVVRRKKGETEMIAALPRPGRGMPSLIGLVLLSGFVLEGLRMAMTGWPGNPGWSFLGYGISLLFKGMPGLTDIYGYVWYAHALLTGGFIALIPFTRMVHIITAPIVLIANAGSRKKD